jgi:hypothetical protein
MDDLLEKLIKKWKEGSGYKDVDGTIWVPDRAQEKYCPQGCELEIYEEEPGWRRITGYDVYRQTRICRTHGFARIYIISGPDAAAFNWTPA